MCSLTCVMLAVLQRRHGAATKAQLGATVDGAAAAMQFASAVDPLAVHCSVRYGYVH